MAKNAQLLFYRFHVQRQAHDALDPVRRQLVHSLADSAAARVMKKTRWERQGSPSRRSDRESPKLADVQRARSPLYRAYLLEETLVDVLDEVQVEVAAEKARPWRAWAVRSRFVPFQ